MSRMHATRCARAALVGSVLVLALAFTGGSASAQIPGCSDSCGSQVLPQTTQAPATTTSTTTTSTTEAPGGETVGGPQSAPPEQPSAPAGGGLPVTGGDILEMAAIALGAVAVGTVLVRTARR